MVGLELHKLFKRKLVWAVFLGVIILIVISELYYYNGELQEKVDVFEKYKGPLTDERLEAFLGEYTMSQFDYIRDMFFDDSGERLGVGSVFSKIHFPIQFGYFEGWLFFLDQLPRYFKYIPVFIAVAFSSLFTYDRECGMQEILFCARKGRKECARAKVAGAFLVTNALYLFALVLPTIAAWSLHGGKGLDTSIQMTPWLRESQLEMNYGTLFLHTIFLSFIVVNAILVVSLLVSFLVKSPMTAMCVTLGVLYLLRPDFMSVSLDNEIANRITAMTPVNVIDTVNLAKQAPITVGGVKLQWLTIAEVLYSVALAVGGGLFFRLLAKGQKYSGK